LVNDLSPEVLACEWIAFCSRRSNPNTITPAMLEIFEAEHFRKKVIAVREKQKEAEYEEKQQVVSIDTKVLKGYGLDQLNGNRSVERTVEDENCNLEVKTEPKVVTVESPVKVQSATLDVPKVTVDPATGLPVPDRVETSYGSTLTNDQWANKVNGTMSVKPFNSDLHIAQPFKYLQMRRHECNLIMNEAIEEMGETLIRKLDLAGFSNLNENERVDRMYVGRVTTDTKDGKVTDKNLYFASPPFGDGHVRLELAPCKSFSLFPGKIVAFNGTFGDEHLLVKDFLDETVNIPAFSSLPVTLKDSLQMIAACGPYTLPDSKNLTPLVRLLEHVKMFEPHYLILMGPFFDCRNDFLLINNDCEQFFKIVMDAISSALRNTRTHAIIVPSTFDLNNYSTFPAPPFQCSAPRVHFMPNPSFLNIEGVVISLSSVDIVRHMLREVIEV
jgi:hypothetical protein